MKAYEELIKFIASRNPREAIDFKPSEPSSQRAWSLVERQKDASLSAEERDGLHHYRELEHLMRLAKARARQLLAHAGGSHQSQESSHSSA